MVCDKLFMIIGEVLLILLASNLLLIMMIGVFNKVKLLGVVGFGCNR